MSDFIFTSEQVSAGHPDKVADQISDALLTEYLRVDKDAHVAIETMVTTQFCIVCGEVKSKVVITKDKRAQIIREKIKQIGYTEESFGFDYANVEIEDRIHCQSADIDQGVEREYPELQGAGDQGIMFGFACNETSSYMPMTYQLATDILRALDAKRKYINSAAHNVPYVLGPDAKCQVSILYHEGKPCQITTILVSTMHHPSLKEPDVKELVLDSIHEVAHRANGAEQKLLNDFLSNLRKGQLLINPTGRFVIGGPDGDTGLTGRKIVCDTYGGWAPHGGGAFSGKDPSKVDRSAAYEARQIALTLVEQGTVDRCLVQLSYAIGVSSPISVMVGTFGTCHDGRNNEELSEAVRLRCALTPYGIIKDLHLKEVDYNYTSSYGHFGKPMLPWESPLEFRL